MATKTAIAVHVSLLYGSKGRQVDDHILAGYHAALHDLTDYQVEQACRREARYGGEFPATADKLLSVGRGFRKSAEAEQARRLHNAEQQKLLGGPQ